MVGEYGYGLLENDIALDVQLVVEDFKKKLGMNLYESTCKIMTVPDNVKINEAVLAVAQLEFDEYGCVKHIDETVTALKDELKDEVLCTWGRPEQRKQELLEFADKANIKLQ